MYELKYGVLNQPPTLLLFITHFLFRNYIMMAITESIQEIIRVLQLTSPTEEGAFAAEQGSDMAGLPGGMLPGSLAAKIYQAKELVSQTGKN